MSLLKHTPVLIAALVIASLRQADAQSIVIQQPVVEQFGVSTVVSVPDRGSALLGSVSSSATFGRRSGPFTPGSNVSRRQRHSGASVHVWIHDFEAMDAALLASAPGRSGSSGSRSPLTGMAAVASKQLLEQHERIHKSRPVVSPQPSSVPVGRDDLSRPRPDQAAAASTLRRFNSRTFR